MNTDTPNRIQFSFRANNDVFNMIESHMKGVNCQTKNEFIEKAIRWYCAKLDGENNDEIVTPELTKAINAAVQAQVNRLAKMMYKEAVSSTMVAMFVATMTDCSDTDFNRIRAKAIQSVRETNGSLNIRDAVYAEQDEE